MQNDEFSELTKLFCGTVVDKLINYPGLWPKLREDYTPNLYTCHSVSVKISQELYVYGIPTKTLPRFLY